MRKAAFLFVACVAMAASANASMYLNEALGSTEGTDWEFIELWNSGPSTLDISGWQVELWDSDTGASYGGADGTSPYAIPAGTTLPTGGYFTFANALAQTGFSFTANVTLPDNSIENSSYTMILADGPGASNIIDSIFVTDGGAGDSANRAGVALTPGGTIGPDGTVLPAGFYRVGDGNPALALLEFNHPHASATPGRANLPEPASVVLIGLAALVLRRR
jgi:hypothetical protein